MKKLKVFSRLRRKNLLKTRRILFTVAWTFYFTTSGNCITWIKMWKVFDMASNQCYRIKWLSVLFGYYFNTFAGNDKIHTKMLEILQRMRTRIYLIHFLEVFEKSSSREDFYWIQNLLWKVNPKQLKCKSYIPLSISPKFSFGKDFTA